MKEFHTSKKDISAGCEVNPPEQYRIANEDVYPEGDTPMQRGSVDDGDWNNITNEASKTVYGRND